MEAKKFIPLAAALVALAYNVAAFDYLARLRDLDQKLLCVIVLFVPGILVMFLIIAGIIYLMGDEGKRFTAKNMIKNAVLGLILVVVFVLLSIALVPTITLDHCLG
jgi:hypothetical protein